MNIKQHIEAGHYQYIVIAARALCVNGGPITIEHYAGCPWPTKKRAVKDGFDMYDSDDFFIGVIRDSKLTHCEDIKGTAHLHTDDLPSIADHIGYEMHSAASKAA